MLTIIPATPIYVNMAEASIDDAFLVGAHEDVLVGGCAETELGFCVDESADDEFVVGGRRKGGADPQPLAEASSECALDTPGAVCSGPAVIELVKKFIVDDMGGDAPTDPALVISAAKAATGCPDEECVLKEVVKAAPKIAAEVADTIDQNMRVTGPENTTTWLTDKNIDGVLKQLMRKHPGTKHMGFHMIDFDKHEKPLSQLDMVRDVLAAGFDSFCVVINTDVYGGPGVHWFCIFCDFRGPGTRAAPWTIEYFNSSGARPAQSVSDWMIKTRYSIISDAEHGADVKIVTAAPIQHQRDTNSECGVYCLYYIYKRIHGEPLATFRTRIPDAVMIAFRKKLFKDRKGTV